jgi:lysophospholipid acyltransferase (LPLAT)-like uncharacterized protein
MAVAKTEKLPRPDIHPAPLLDRFTDAAIWLFALLAVAMFRIIDSTLDLRIFGHEHVAAVLRSKRPFLVVVWHGRGLLPIFFFQGYPLVVYSSQSRAQTAPALSRYVRKLTLASLRHLGYQVLDASTFHSESRGVIRFLQYLERGNGGLIAADGPAGPMFRAKPGAAYVAKKTRVALLPVAAAIRDAIALDSWDRFEIPRPFSKATLAIGPALDVPEDISEEALASLSTDLEGVLNDLTARAEVEVFAT